MIPEFVWRQPIIPGAYSACLRAMYCDEVGSYAVDGNRHWTPELVREWWSRTPELLVWAENHLLRKDDPVAFKQGYDVTDKTIFREYVRFLKYDAEEYLSSYIFLLLEGRPVKSGDPLPSL
jgi:hypothetical protein